MYNGWGNFVCDRMLAKKNGKRQNNVLWKCPKRISLWSTRIRDKQADRQAGRVFICVFVQAITQLEAQTPVHFVTSIRPQQLH